MYMYNNCTVCGAASSEGRSQQTEHNISSEYKHFDMNYNCLEHERVYFLYYIHKRLK